MYKIYLDEVYREACKSSKCPISAGGHGQHSIIGEVLNKKTYDSTDIIQSSNIMEKLVEDNGAPQGSLVYCSKFVAGFAFKSTKVWGIAFLVFW